MSFETIIDYLSLYGPDILVYVGATVGLIVFLWAIHRADGVGLKPAAETATEDYSIEAWKHDLVHLDLGLFLTKWRDRMPDKTAVAVAEAKAYLDEVVSHDVYCDAEQPPMEIDCSDLDAEYPNSGTQARVDYNKNFDNRKYEPYMEEVFKPHPLMDAIKGDEGPDPTASDGGTSSNANTSGGKFKPGDWVRGLGTGRLYEVIEHTGIVKHSGDEGYNVKSDTGVRSVRRIEPALPREGEWWVRTTGACCNASIHYGGEPFRVNYRGIFEKYAICGCLVPVNFGKGKEPNGSAGNK